MDFAKLLKKIPFSYMKILEDSIGEAKSILDLGCGDGSLMQVISDGHDWRITGVDIYDKWLEEASKKGIYKNLIKGDLNQVCKKFVKNKKKFDVVFCSQTIEHITKRKGEELLALAENLARRRIIFGTPRGYMEQPDVFLKRNPFQKHKSGWSEEEFEKRGYTVRGIGFSPVWSENGFARTKSKLLMLMYSLISFLMSPLVYFYPRLGAGILCIKEVGKNRNVK
ncbi:MAG: class I SAM-dependent methyltransferase [Candidatus Anstonellales archaeon]